MTLIYADIFDYPLKAYEIHKWLIKKQTLLQSLQKSLDKLKQEKKIEEYKTYYFLPKRKQLVIKRIKNAGLSKKLIIKAKIITQILRIIPWIKLVGISGGLAIENACKKDDIDIFVITAKNRLWLVRLFSILLLTPFRRTKNSKDVAGKFCLNIFIDEDNLAQRKDLYTAHEILQMRVIWEKDGMYRRFLEENEWAFRILPNWTTRQIQSARFARRAKCKVQNSKDKSLDILENLAKWLQLRIMQKAQGMERISDSALYFHPQDCRQRVLDEYRLTVLKYRHDT